MERDREFCWMIWDLSPLNIVVAEAKRLWHQCDPHRASAFTSPAFVDAIVHDYRAVRHLPPPPRTRDRDRLVDYVLQERRTMVNFLNTRNPADIAATRNGVQDHEQPDRSTQ